MKESEYHSVWNPISLLSSSLNLGGSKLRKKKRKETFMSDGAILSPGKRKEKKWSHLMPDID